ncbi:uncharacterized protein HMPREF1541_00997 [Cyphellophora europaea CBS 101466]|uniref:Glycosyltransferase 2-like domain-containing protein n=1 Tax=Cyphellophora europaea (strain CBS 101466) TaxID=1220924 RepID=W2SFJ4_CYPE1|nr:uncharacterized protein HMPREF1541_00997 [Cyphellophora europaea CBS 101466]ETN46808.1 hypothetical protein HMPREF1541_00997 [Cyphellophora europaea CBS 101466]
MDPYYWFVVFLAYFAYRYVRLVINLVAFWTFKSIPIPENPTLTNKDVTVILPTLEGQGEELERTIKSIMLNEPYELILVTVDDNLVKAQKTVAKMPAGQQGRLRCMSIKQANKRRQMARAIPEVRTEIIVFADDDVDWPQKLLLWILAPFEHKIYGGVVTCQRLRRAEKPTFSQRIYGFLGALYLERRNFDCAATSRMDGGMACISGRTCAYRASILQDINFTNGFTNEKWWFGQYQLNADDDNFITRWLVNHKHEVRMQYHPECEVKTTLENDSKFLKQCLRWARSNWRSNLTSLFAERNIWTQQPWSTYAVQLTTLSPPALLGDALLWWLLWLGTADWSIESSQNMFWFLLAWMTFSKFIKLITHFVRYPVDVLLWPVSILFGWIHGAIKMYALATLSETTWGSRAGADADDKDRMIKQPQLQPRSQYEYFDEKIDEKLPLHEAMNNTYYDTKRTPALAA